MLDDAFFVSEEIHEREVELADGSRHKMYFRELAAGEFQRYAWAIQSDDESRKIDAVVKLIVASLCEPDGKPALTLDRARKLKSVPMLAIFNAVQEVNQGPIKKPTAGDSGTS